MILSLKHQLVRDKGLDLFVPIFIRASLKMTAIDIPCIPTDTAVKMENEDKLRALVGLQLISVCCARCSCHASSNDV